jgi:Amt family ammonium transporter
MAGYVAVTSSALVGITSAIVGYSIIYSRLKAVVDDTLDVFVCHGVSGALGVLLSAVLQDATLNVSVSNGLIHGHGTTLWVSCVVLVLVTVYVIVVSAVLFWAVDKAMPLRVSDTQERQGLDASLHMEGMWDGVPVVNMKAECDIEAGKRPRLVTAVSRSPLRAL